MSKAPTTYAAAIERLRETAMSEGVHYMHKPEERKDVLLKAGAELVCQELRLLVDPNTTVERLPNGHTSYGARVTLRKLSDQSAVSIGVAECSTAEDRLAWIDAPSEAAFEQAPQHSRRKQFIYGQDDPLLQIRTNPADSCNTALKLAKKRALVDAVLSLGGSALFTQDREEALPGRAPRPTAPKKPQTKRITAHAISAIRHALASSEMAEQTLLRKLKLRNLSDMPYDRLNEAMAIAKQGKPSE